MYQGLFLLLIALCAAPVSSTAIAPPSTTSVERAREILRRVDDLWRGESSHATITMRVKTAHYERTMTMEAWSKGTEQSLVRIQTPIKERGTATLKSGSHIYSYLPRTDRTIRLTSGMMTGSWMGSHFTNDDLVRESRMEEDYTPAISFEGVRDGMAIIEFTLYPKADAAVVWGKVVVVVREADLLPLSQLYYDEDGIEARTMSFSDFRQLGGAERPARMRVVPADKPDEYTELIYHSLDLNIGLEQQFFSISQLKRKR